LLIPFSSEDLATGRNLSRIPRSERIAQGRKRIWPFPLTEFSSFIPRNFAMSTHPDDPVVLRSVPTEAEASAIVLALKDRGIDAATTGGYTAGFRAESPGLVQVIVKSADADRAQIALESIEQGSAEIDWSKIDVGQPED
jgi:hypothetical protein